MRTFFLIPVLVAGVMAGCSPVGPDYKRVDPPVPARFGSLEKGISTPESIQTESLASWWKIFNDSILDSLMKRAEEGSLDLRTRFNPPGSALSLGSESQQYPEGGLNAAYQRSRRPESGLAGLGTSGTGSLPSTFNPTNRETDLYLVGFDASWEIDIFGGIRREIEAAHADLGARRPGRIPLLCRRSRPQLPQRPGSTGFCAG
jgi:multidrug efflux system outer membrane protein